MAALCAGLLALNAAALAALTLLTSGWAFKFLFVLGREHPKVPTYGAYVDELTRSTGLALLVAVALTVILSISAVKAPKPRRVDATASPTGARAH